MGAEAAGEWEKKQMKPCNTTGTTELEHCRQLCLLSGVCESERESVVFCMVKKVVIRVFFFLNP